MWIEKLFETKLDSHYYSEIAYPGAILDDPGKFNMISFVKKINLLNDKASKSVDVILSGCRCD